MNPNSLIRFARQGKKKKLEEEEEEKREGKEEEKGEGEEKEKEDEFSGCMQRGGREKGSYFLQPSQTYSKRKTGSPFGGNHFVTRLTIHLSILLD